MYNNNIIIKYIRKFIMKIKAQHGTLRIAMDSEESIHRIKSIARSNVSL